MVRWYIEDVHGEVVLLSSRGQQTLLLPGKAAERSPYE